jgi:hypothetical protein
MAPSTQWKENIDPGEAARLEMYAETLHAIQKKRDAQGPVGRALHPKGHLGLKAEFTVLPDLPDYAKVGIFAQPATYQAYVRFSNGGGTSNDDRQGDIRAIAVKLLGVGGKKIIHGLENAPTQDFLLIGAPALPFKNADEFVPFVTNIGKPLGLLSIIFKVGLGRTLAIIKTVTSAPKRPTISLATMRYYSAASIQFGPYAAHYTLKPHAVDAPGAQPGQTPNYLAEEFSARIKREAVVYDFAVQFFVDETQTPIEDTSVVWKEEVSPFVTLGRLTISPQDPDSALGRKLHEFIEKLSFDIWHAPEEFRPLGNIMRARRVAYKASAKERQALAEPDGSEKFE